MNKTGLVIRALAGFFYVQIDDQILECKASKKITHRKDRIIVGDYVIVDTDENYIIDYVKRTHELIRPQIANVSKSFLVFSAKEPEINTGLLDRMLLNMTYNDLECTLIITKCDLLTAEELEQLKKDLMYYQNNLTDIYYLKMDDDVEPILNLLHSEKYVITGQTGVGKSTLINRLIPNLNLQTQAISKALGRGKHTTREVNFYMLNNSYLIDTPGFSSLDLDYTPENIRDCYSDFFKLAPNCKFNGCYHENEPSCAVKQAVETGDIPQDRYDNYLKNLKQAKETEWKKYK